MSAIILIDTTQSENVQVALEYKSGMFKKTASSRAFKSQMVLPLVEELLSEHGLHTSDIAQIRVKEGPGSFTGIRVGLAIANTLGTLLHIPVNGKRTLALPQY